MPKRGKNRKERAYKYKKCSLRKVLKFAGGKTFFKAPLKTQLNEKKNSKEREKKKKNSKEREKNGN